MFLMASAADQSPASQRTDADTPVSDDDVRMQRVAHQHERHDSQIRSGTRDPRSLHVVANALPKGIAMKFPTKPFPTSAAAWRR